jgi:hypothetical protein
MPELVSKAGILLDNKFKTWTNIFQDRNFNGAAGIVDSDDKNTRFLGSKTSDQNGAALFFELSQVLDGRGFITDNPEQHNGLHFKFKSGEMINLSPIKHVFKGKIRFFDNSEWNKQIKKYNNEHFSLSGENNFLAMFCPNRIKLLWQQGNLMEKDGLRVSVLTDIGDFDSLEGNWQLSKTAENKMQILISWPDQSCRGKWEFELNDQTINWKVVLVVKQRILIKNIYINLFAKSSLNKWFSSEQQGSIEFKSADTDSIALFDNRSDFIGLYSQKISEDNPAVVLKPLVDMKKWFLHIYKYYKDEVIACGANRVIKPEGEYLATGEHEIFNGQISMIDNPRTIELLKADCAEPDYMIRSGEIALAIDRAKVRLYWNGQELTNLLGLHTAFLNQQSWVDSSIAAWQTDVRENKATILLHWSDICVRQKWQLSLINENEILWDIDTQLGNQAIDVFSARLMLNPNYSHYQAEGKNELEFPAEFEPGSWQEMISADKQISAISKRTLLPDVFFEGKISQSDSNNIIENSDLLHSARVLKCEARKIHKNQRSESFSSQVKIKLRQNNGIN